MFLGNNVGNGNIEFKSYDHYYISWPIDIEGVVGENDFHQKITTPEIKSINYIYIILIAIC
jgi:hypothetical protein